MIISADWQRIPAADNSPQWIGVDADYELKIAGYTARIAWRADYMSWEVFHQGYARESGGFYADSSNSNSASEEMYYALAQSEAQRAIRELIADANAASIVRPLPARARDYH